MTLTRNGATIRLRNAIIALDSRGIKKWLEVYKTLHQQVKDHFLVLDAQPPLPNAILVRLVEHEDEDDQE